MKGRKQKAFHREGWWFVFIKRNQAVFFERTFSVAAIISGTSNPYFFNNWSGVPLSPKVSLVPTYSIGIGKFLAATWAMASPRPPIILCSSTVTAHLVFRIEFKTASSSRGLIVWILITSTLSPFS